MRNSRVQDKVAILRVFALRARRGERARNAANNPIGAKHTSDELYRVAQTFTELGHPDPRLGPDNRIDFRLRALFRAMAKEDPPPTRVKPIPLQVLQQAQTTANTTATMDDSFEQAVMAMAWLAFFYLLRPGEYAHTRSETKPITWDAIALIRHGIPLDTRTCPENDLFQASHATITFDTQKNRNRGEVVAHASSGHLWSCPVRAMARRILHLRRNNAPFTTPLCAWYPFPGAKTLVTGNDITALLRSAAAQTPQIRYKPSDVTARSLRAGGAMALLIGKVDITKIRLQGRWRSDAVFRYLHSEALPLVDNLASTMVDAGAYTLLPGTGLPAEGLRILQEEARLASQWTTLQQE